MHPANEQGLTSESRKKTSKYFSQTLVRNKNLLTFATPKTTGRHTKNNGSEVKKNKDKLTSVTKSLRVIKELALLITTRKFFDRLGNKETA